MSQTEVLNPLLARFSQAGFPEVRFEVRGDLLVIQLSQPSRSRLFADSVLRREIVAQAQALGFSRIAVELPSS